MQEFHVNKASPFWISIRVYCILFCSCVENQSINAFFVLLAPHDSLSNCLLRPQVTFLVYSMKLKRLLWNYSQWMSHNPQNVNKSVKSCVQKLRRNKRSLNHMLQRYSKKYRIVYMFLPDIPSVAVWWPLMGLPPRSLVSTSHHKKENIQADPRIAHTQSKANTLCHVHGLSHVLSCFWPLMSSPECPEWYPHHPVGWLTPLNRKGLLPWPTMLTEKAERSLDELHHILFRLSCTWNIITLWRGEGPAEEKIYEKCHDL